MTFNKVTSEIEQESLQVIILPKTSSPIKSFRTIKQIHPTTGLESDFLIIDEAHPTKLYELNKTDFKDSYNGKQRLTKDSKPLKSILLIPNDTTKSSLPGLILGKRAEIYVSTEFNTVYLILQYFLDVLKKESRRILTYDDLSEQFEESELLGGLIKLGFDLTKPLTKICELVQEGDETFYKVSLSKIIQYLKGRITKIVSRFPRSLDAKISKRLVVPAGSSGNLKLTDELTNLNRIKASVFLLSSYVDSWYLNILLKEYNFEPLEKFISELVKIEEMNDVAQQNLDNLNKSLTNDTALNPKKRKAAPAANKSKKQAAKVQAGRGALDMFFKKKN